MTTCQYCGNEFPKYRARHESVCPRSPHQATRLREFMRYWAEDERGLARAMYTDFAADYKAEHGESLPGPNEIERAYGSWQAFVASCGLLYSSAHYRPPRSQLGLDPVTMPGSILADDSMHHDPSCLRCDPVQRPVRRWEWRGRTWAVVGAQLVWQVR